jgi:hypothetical protein
MTVSADLEIVRAALAGDRRAFDRLFDVCFGMASRFVAARPGPPEEFQERVRQAVRAIFSSLPQYRGQTPLFVFAFVAMTWSLAPQAQPAASAPVSRAGAEPRAAGARG